MQQNDPDFDPAALEDRASVMFWRKATADRLGKIDPLRKIAAPEFADAYTAHFRGDSGKARVFVADCAVGSVQTLGVFTESGRDRAVVEIRWSGKRFAADPQGRKRGSGDDVWASTLYILGRNAGSKTDAGKSISSAHCPNCGAPESGGASNSCEFCGTVLNDGAHGWVLENVVSKTEQAAQSILARLRSGTREPTMEEDGSGNGNGVATPDAMGLLAWMAKVATADGAVDAREREMLAKLASRRNVPANYVDSLLDAGLRGNLAIPDPSSGDEARVWLGAMAEEAWADGKITREEMQLLRSVGGQAGLSDYDVNLVIRKARASVYGEARDALRAQKRG
jgi:tellurite resistance protein